MKKRKIVHVGWRAQSNVLQKASMLRGLVVFVFFCAIMNANPLKANGVFDLYQMAKARDPEFLMAHAELAADFEKSNVAKANLLPKMSVDGQFSPDNRQRISFARSDGTHGISEDGFSSRSTTFSMRQALFDLESWNYWKQTKEEFAVAEYKLRDVEHGLIIRVFEAYVDALFANDQLDIAQSQYDALLQHLSRNKAAFRSRDATHTDVAETEAQVRLAEVSLIEAKDELAYATHKLMVMTGLGERDVQRINRARLGIVEKLLPKLKTVSMQDWSNVASTRNANVQLRRRYVEAARLARNRSRASGLPTLHLVAEHVQKKPGSGSLPESRSRDSNVSLMLSVPLYSGGGAAAAVRQAEHQVKVSVHELEATINEVRLELAKQYRLVKSGEARIKAEQKAVHAAEIALEGNLVALSLGERVNIDVLEATQKLFSSRSALKKAIYDVLKSWLYLKYHAGILVADDLKEVDGFFGPIVTLKN